MSDNIEKKIYELWNTYCKPDWTGKIRQMNISIILHTPCWGYS